MREIKFRAWDIKNKVMITDVTPVHSVGSFIIGGNLEPLVQIKVDNSYPWPCEVMQYTGLLDDNDKEIYEGDIVKIDDGYGLGGIHQVKYMAEKNYPAFDLIPYIDVDENGLSWIKAVGDIKVIGNIYENPELLEVSNV